MNTTQTSPSLLTRPSAFLPMLMSLASLSLVVLHVLRYGVMRDTDEGTSAHLFQLLMAGQVPVIGYFAVTSLAERPRQALVILALQAAAGAAALGTLYVFEHS